MEEKDITREEEQEDVEAHGKGKKIRFGDEPEAEGEKTDEPDVELHRSKKVR